MFIPLKWREKTLSTLTASLQIRKEEAILLFFLQNVFDKARNTIKQARENQWWLIQNIVYANNFTLLPFVTYDKNVHTLVTISEDTFLIRVSFKYNKWHIKRFFGQRDTQIEPTKTPPWLAPSTEIFKICDSRYSKNALPGSVCS